MDKVGNGAVVGAPSTEQHHCQWCGNYHRGICPKIRSMDFDQYGTLQHIEFFNHSIKENEDG